jgi:EmrB/QacA subfamily drug resistance transporter
MSIPSTNKRHDNLPDGPDAIRVAIPFAAIVLAMLPAVLDQTILATALPTIAGDLGSLSDVSWVVTAYVVAAAASMPLWGKLGDRHGRKLLLEISLAVFVLASALCAAAQDIPQLIAVRMVQGAAAGGLMTLAMAAVGDLVAPRERGRYQGYIAAVFATATVVGPLIGGVLVENASWRWVFLVNLPIGLAALAVLNFRLPAPPTEGPDKPLDALGAALLAGATSSLMLACIWGGGRYAWDSAPIVGLIAAMVALSAALFARERRADDPIVPFHLLRTRTVAVASAALFLGTAALFSVTVFVPLLLQTATGASPTEAGLLIAPAMLGIAVSTSLSGRSIARTGRYKRFPIMGLTLMTGGLVLLAAFAADPSALTIGLGLVVFGLGFGLVTQVLITAVQNGVERRDLGIAMAVTGFFRGLGGAVGAAVLGAVFASQAGSHVSDASAAGLAGALRGDVIDGAQAVFLVAAPFAAIALAVVLRLPESPLRTQQQETSSGGDADVRSEQADHATRARGALREGQPGRRGRIDSSRLRQPRGAARQPSGSRGPEGDGQLAARPVGADAK